MDQRFRRGFTAAEKTELWDRWQRGEQLKAIGRAFGKSSIYNQVAPHGGIRPAPRRRSRLALTLPEREEISRGIAAHQSARSMARLLGRSPSTVSRELSRNGGYDRYRAAPADEKAWVRARRPKRCKLANSPRLRQAVASKLRLNWAPEQIAGWLKRAHPHDECYSVSHETIYRSLFVQARGVLKKELLGHLRSKRTIRLSKQARMHRHVSSLREVLSQQTVGVLIGTALPCTLRIAEVNGDVGCQRKSSMIGKLLNYTKSQCFLQRRNINGAAVFVVQAEDRSMC